MSGEEGRGYHYSGVKKAGNYDNELTLSQIADRENFSYVLRAYSRIHTEGATAR